MRHRVRAYDRAKKYWLTAWPEYKDGRVDDLVPLLSIDYRQRWEGWEEIGSKDFSFIKKQLSFSPSLRQLLPLSKIGKMQRSDAIYSAYIGLVYPNLDRSLAKRPI